MRRLLSAATCAVLSIALWAPPASAASSSPLPTARVLRSNVTQGGEALVEFGAVDADGLIFEIVIFWGDGSLVFADSFPCLIPPIPEPGTPHRFLISHDYEKPGTYRVNYFVSSISDCSGEGKEQHSHPYGMNIVVP